MKPIKVGETLNVFVGNANGKGLIRIERGEGAPHGTQGDHVASLTRDLEPFADEIVHRWNAHEALLKALKAQYAAPFSVGQHDAGNGVTHRDEHDGARTGCRKCIADELAKAAIQKAKR